MQKNARLIAIAVAIVLLAIALVLILTKKPGDAGEEGPPVVETESEPTPTPLSEENNTTEPTGDDATTQTASAGAGGDEPLWGLTLGPLNEGDYEYRIQADDRLMEDPRNEGEGGYPPTSKFTYPLSEDERIYRSPKPAGEGRIRFTYQGEIDRSVLFIADFRGGYWGRDEYRPLNEAAKRNMQAILADPSLSIVQGMVLDEDREPIPGALVRAAKGTSPFQKTHLRTVKCDDNGVFRIDRLPLTRVSLTAKDWGYQQSEWKAVEVLPDEQTESVTIVLREASLVRGKVTDSSQRPIAHAKVSATEKAGMPSASQGDFTYTDERGLYTLASLGPGSYEMSAEHDDYASAVKTDIAVEPKKDAEVNFVLSSGVLLQGRVVQKRGEEDVGVEGARVYVMGPATDDKGNVARRIRVGKQKRSDADGEFVFEHLPTDTELRCWAMKGEMRVEDPKSLSFKEGEQPGPIVLRLPDMGRIRGYVLDQNERPVAEASVELDTRYQRRLALQMRNRGSEGEDDDDAPNATTNEQGYFELEDLAANRQYSLRVTADGYAPTRTPPIPADGEDEVEIRLFPGAELAGTVTRTDTNAPASEIELVAQARDHGDSMMSQATTDATGAFTFDDLSPAVYTISGQSPEDSEETLIVEAQSVEVEPPDIGNEPIQLKAYPAITVKGRVLLKGSSEPVAQAEVHANSLPSERGSQQHIPNRFGRNSEATTDRDGRFEITGLAPGVIRVEAEKTGLVGSEVDRRKRTVDNASGVYPEKPSSWKLIDAEAGKTPPEVELRLGEGGSIGGRLLNSNDQPVGGVTLMAEPSRDSSRRPQIPFNRMANAASSDYEGKFTITGLPLDGSYRVATTPYGEGVYAASDYVELTEDSPSATVTLKVAASGSISGTIRDEEGEALTGAMVRARCTDEGVQYRGGSYVMSGSEGQYRLENLPLGAYQLYVQKEGYENNQSTQTSIESEEGVTGVDVVLKADEDEKGDAVLAGLLLDLNANPLPEWYVRVGGVSGSKPPTPSGTITAYDGSFRFENLQDDGSYVLSFSARNMDASVQAKTGTVHPTGEEEVFVIPLGGVATGRLLYEQTEDPVTDASMQLRQMQSGEKQNPEGGQCVIEHYNLSKPAEPDEDGRFEVGPLPMGSFMFMISGNTIVSRQTDPFSIGGDLRTDLGDVFVQGGFMIKGRLVDGANGGPYTGPDHRYAPVRVSGERYSGEPLSQLRLEGPDEGGRFTIAGAPTDIASITFQPTDRLPATVDNIGSPKKGIANVGDIELDPGASIRGKVEGPNGETVRAAQVSFMMTNGGQHIARNARTNEDGEFTLEGLPAGEGRLNVYAYKRVGNDWIVSEKQPATIQNHEVTVKAGREQEVTLRFPEQQQ